MGNEPLEEEIPVEFEDFCTDLQEAFTIYSRLKDDWDGFNGTYKGKIFLGIKDIFEIYEIPREDWRTTLELINVIDYYRSQNIKEKLEMSRSKTSA